MVTRRQAIGGGVAAAVAAAMWPRRSRATFGLLGGAANGTIPSTNAVGFNLNGPTSANTTQIFLNILKGCGGDGSFFQNWSGWNTHDGSGETNEEAYLQLDSDGYVISLTASPIPSGGQQFTYVSCYVNNNLGTSPGASGPYPGGNYRLQFQGAGTIQIAGLDAATSLSSSSAGISISGTTITSTQSVGQTAQVTFDIATPSSGIELQLTAISSGNYFKAMSVVLSAYASAYDGGQIFHPNFLAWLQSQPLKCIRYMDFMSTNKQLQYGNGDSSLMFTANPASGNTSGVLTAAWTNPSGAYLITLQNGQSLSATFTVGSTAVSFATAVASNCTAAWAYMALYSSWDTRTPQTAFSYATSSGPPWEAVIALANTLGVDAWINIPVWTDAVPAYWTSLATLFQTTLNANRKVYVEYTNELWNSGFASQQYANYKSIAQFGSSDWGAYYGEQISKIADVFAAVYGDPGFDDRVVCVCAGQAANTQVLKDELRATSWVDQGNIAPWLRVSPSGQKTIKAVAIAPYFGEGAIPTADFTHLQAQPDGGYDDFFASFTANPVNGYTFHDGTTDLPAGGWFGEAAGWVSATVTTMASFGSLPILGYEGGWQFDTLGGQTGQTTFQVTAHRDARMKSAYDTYLTQMASAGMQWMNCYEFCSPAGGTQWGAIESPMQPVTPLSGTPAVWQGIAQYAGG